MIQCMVNGRIVENTPDSVEELRLEVLEGFNDEGSPDWSSLFREGEDWTEYYNFLTLCGFLDDGFRVVGFLGLTGEERLRVLAIEEMVKWG